MKQPDDLPIEPLSEAAFARVESAVFAELDARIRVPAPQPRRLSRRLTIALVAAVALPLGAVLALAWRETSDPARVGPAQTTLVSTRVVANEASTDTMLGDVSIHLERGASLVAVRDGASGSLVLLERGVARFAVPPRAQRPFAVQAADVLVEVVGTRFQVSRNESGVGVHTTEGIVRVISGGRTVLLPAGASFDSTTSSPRPVLPRQSGSESTNQTSSEPTNQTSVPDAGSRSDLGEDAAARAGAVGPAGARGASTSDPRERFEQASRLEVSDPTTSLRIYASLVARGGRWGEAALYAQGRLELELGHTKSAERLLQRYLREHPEGANESDVRLLLVGLVARPQVSE